MGVRLISYPDTYFHYLRPGPRLAIEPCWICLSRLGYLPWSNDIARYQTTHPGGCPSLTCTPYKPRKAHQKRSQISEEIKCPASSFGPSLFPSGLLHTGSSDTHQLAPITPLFLSSSIVWNTLHPLLRLIEESLPLRKRPGISIRPTVSSKGRY